jgi:hypothetical protein
MTQPMTQPVTSSTMRIPGAQFEKSEDQAARVYRIGKPLAAVRFDLAAKGQIVFLPEGSELCVVGPSALVGCFEVLCEERLYNIFKADLLGVWSVPIKPRRRKPIPSLCAVGAYA